ncbi:MAG: TIGR00375 family protein [Armatimonadetes bacterium]|nr:TIGR00375 family protein [Armatimonadota bacterium]
MRLFYTDLHVHIGKAGNNRAVKITASHDLTFANIARECLERKGIDIVGVIDCASPWVLQDIQAMMANGEMEERPQGGLRYRDSVTVICGAEIETVEPEGGISHQLCYFPTVEATAAFSRQMSEYITNIGLSSQSSRLPARSLFNIVHALEGVLIPAHAFTPHKSVYGSCADRLARIFPEVALAAIPAIELGLSADTDLADRIGELSRFAFLTNSDAHSLPKIGREYNALMLEEATFKECLKAMRREEGCYIAANYGLDPKLGKYHRTCCEDCGHIARNEPPVEICERCGSVKVTRGVLDRIARIQDWEAPRHPERRPPYRHQVPLQFVPGCGAVALLRLINRFGSEMNVLHQAAFEELSHTVGPKVAANIVLARDGQLHIHAGGGGKYGRALSQPEDGQLDLW